MDVPMYHHSAIVPATLQNSTFLMTSEPQKRLQASVRESQC